MSDIETAEQLGIDLTLIEESLRLTPEQRALQHQRALEMALQMQAAYQAHADTGAKRGGNDRTEPAVADAVRR